MPVKPKKLASGKYQVVEASSGKKTPSSGTFSSRKEALAQSNKINMELEKQGKI